MAAKSGGYGLFWLNGSTVAAHRLAYVAAIGSLSDDRELDHICGNRACVRPSHLRLVTHAENVLAGRNFSADNAKKVRCPKGHEYRVKKRGRGVQRYCAECAYERTMVARKAARQAKWAKLWEGL